MKLQVGEKQVCTGMQVGTGRMHLTSLYRHAGRNRYRHAGRNRPHALERHNKVGVSRTKPI